ncbi:MAG TPA: Uma2 family endonuclease [Gemmataceae bacterium]|jgi:Uma2 family endonuclease|nr:Uma2 family endonuclease [Gemmataceae bacterium]
MATATQGRLLTAEEFMELPNPIDGSKQELVRGVVITMPPPKAIHGYCAAQATIAIGGFVGQHRLGILVANDTGVLLERGPDTVRGPDVAYWSFKRQAFVPDGYFELAPDLAVEVLSPSNTRKQIDTKIREYLKAGTKLVWVIDPLDRSVRIYRTDPDRAVFLHSGATLDGEDVLPGFQFPVTGLFPPETPDAPVQDGIES